MRPGPTGVEPSFSRVIAFDAGMSRSANMAIQPKCAATSARWRMLLAAERLAADDEPVATIASALGYESESSFGKAFRRIIGEAPRRFARGPARSAL